MPRSGDLDAVFARYVATRAPELLAIVFEETADRLLRRARRLVGDRDLAEDLVQDTFLVVAENSTGFDPRRRCLPYLLGILSWRAWRARAQRRLQGDPREPHGDDEQPLRRALGSEIEVAVGNALGKLPARYADVLAPYLFERRSPTEIAGRLGRPASTVRVQVHRGLQLLRAALPKGIALGLLLATRPSAAAPAGPHGRRPVARCAPAAAAGVVLATAAALWLMPSTGAPPAARSVAGVAMPGAPAQVTPLADPVAPHLARSAVRAEATATGTLRLRLVQEDGTPATGIGVRVVREPGIDPAFGELRRSVDAAGTLVVTDLPPGEVRVHVDRGIEATAIVRAGAAVEQRVVVPDGVVVRGRVVDADGNGVGGAGIWVCDRPRHPWEGQVVATSAPDGAFELRGMRPMAAIAACMPGRAPSACAAVGEAPSGALEVELELGGVGGAVAGEVVDATGRAVSGAVVLAGVCPRSEALVSATVTARWPPNRRTVSDARGRFALDGLPVGPLRVLVRSRDHVTTVEDVELHAGQRTWARITLDPGSTVSGAVLDVRGRPVVGAHVQVEGEERWQWASATTARDGSFRIDGVSRVRAVVWVEAPGFGPFRRSLAPAEREGCRLVLPDPVRVHGRFLRAAGEAVTGLEVCAAPTEPHWATRLPESVPVAADGRFALEVPEGATHLFVRSAEQPVWLRAAPLDAVAGDLELPDGFAACGAVRVRLEHVPHDPAAILLLAERDGWTYALNTAFDAATAVLRSAAIPEGAYAFRLAGVDGSVPPVALGSHVVRRGGIDLGSVDLRCGTLRYRFTSVDGLPLAQLAAWVLPIGAGPSAPIPLHGAAGQQALSPGTYRVSVRTWRHVELTDCVVEVRAARTSEVDVALEPGMLREIRFRLPGALSAGARCRLLGPSGRLLLDDVLAPDVDGRFALPFVLAAGVHRLEVERGDERFAARIDVTATAPGVLVARPVAER